MFNKFLLLLTLGGLAGVTSADLLFLTNGDRITGQIVKMSGASVTIWRWSSWGVSDHW